MKIYVALSLIIILLASGCDDQSDDPSKVSWNGELIYVEGNVARSHFKIYDDETAEIYLVEMPLGLKEDIELIARKKEIDCTILVLKSFLEDDWQIPEPEIDIVVDGLAALCLDAVEQAKLGLDYWENSLPVTMYDGGKPECSELSVIQFLSTQNAAPILTGGIEITLSDYQCGSP